MNLYIMRHGIAWDHGDWDGRDDERPLTEEGIARTRKVLAQLVGSEDLAVDAIWSSPFRRALQTAELAAEALSLKVKIVDHLECGANLPSLMRLIKKDPLPARTMLVGHEPDCGILVADLVGEETHPFPFKRAGIAKLSGEFKPGGMKLIWQRTPREVLGD